VIFQLADYKPKVETLENELARERCAAQQLSGELMRCRDALTAAQHRVEEAHGESMLFLLAASAAEAPQPRSPSPPVHVAPEMHTPPSSSLRDRARQCVVRSGIS
jgi:hypothetical protein